jgi:hypothetical protein
MVLVDTSVWIELLAGRLSVRREDLPRLAVCGPIVQEVLQGLKPGLASESFREAFSAIPVLNDPISLNLFVAAADIYRQGRRRGMTIRSSTDCLIAAIAIANSVPVWHRDRDFGAIATFTALETSALPTVRK